jgi:hypothetical protein
MSILYPLSCKFNFCNQPKVTTLLGNTFLMKENGRTYGMVIFNSTSP